MRTALTLLAVLGMVTVANAAVLSVEVVEDTTDPASAGLVAYKITINTDTAISAWGGSIDGDLEQFWIFGSQTTPSLDNAANINLAGGNINDDTHFMFLNDTLLTVNPPAETMTSLTGDFGLKPAAQTTSLLLARVVLPEGAEAVMTSNITTVQDTSQQAANAVIPEPATMTLLGLGGLALIRRRK